MLTESIKTHLDLIKWHQRLDNLNDTNVINNFINDEISFCINSFIPQFCLSESDL